MTTVHSYHKIAVDTAAGKRGIAYSGRATTGAALEFFSNAHFFSEVKCGLYIEICTYECVYRHKNGARSSMKIELGLKCLDVDQMKKFLIYEGDNEQEFESALKRALEEFLD